MPKFSRPIYKCFTVAILFFALIESDYSQTDWIELAIMELKSPEPAIRLQAMGKLSNQPADVTLVPLISVLNDTNDEVRRAAVGNLGQLKDKRAIAALVPMINDNDGLVRTTATWALGNIGDPDAVEPLLKALSKADWGLKFHIIEALGVLDDPRSVEALFKQGGPGQNALGTSSVERMCEILTNKKSPDRWYALKVLERVADERAMNALISVLGVGENAIGHTAANILAWRIGKPAVPRLITALKNRDLRVRVNAVQALTHINDEQAREALIKCATNDSDPSVRRHLVEIFGIFANHTWGPVDEHIIATLLIGMRDKNVEIRLIALNGLSGVHRDDVFQALVNALSDPVTSAEASIALGNRKDLRVLPQLLRTLTGENPALAAAAAGALIEIGEPAIDGLIAVLTDKNKEFPLREIRREEALAKARAELPFGFFGGCGIKPPPPILDPRVLAARALGSIGNERALGPLTEAVKDESSQLHEAAVAALDRLNKKRSP